LVAEGVGREDSPAHGVEDIVTADVPTLVADVAKITDASGTHFHALISYPFGELLALDYIQSEIT
jgi:hypothetical protein